jgi:molybdopterin converting factor small subunit
MKLHVLAFGITKEIVAGSSFDIEVGDTSTVESVRILLEEKFPQLKQLACLRIALNNEFAEENQTVRAEDELALLPPVSGG